jgi:hypothetical protein
VWARQQVGNQIRDLLKDFYPAALVAFAGLPSGGLARADARTILAAAPTPAEAARLTPARAAPAADQGRAPTRSRP